VPQAVEGAVTRLEWSTALLEYYEEHNYKPLATLWYIAVQAEHVGC
jgi:hypothetical protein